MLYGPGSDNDTASEAGSEDALMIDEPIAAHHPYGHAQPTQLGGFEDDEETDDEGLAPPMMQTPASHGRDIDAASDATISDTEERPGLTGVRAGGGGSESDATISDSEAPGPGGPFAQRQADDSGTESDGEAGARRPAGVINKELWEAEARRMYVLWKTNPQEWLWCSKRRWFELRERKRAYVALTNPSTSARAGVKGGITKAGSGSLGRPKVERAPKAKPPPKPRAPKAKAGGLKLLLQEGMLVAGVGVLKILYMNQTFVGDLDSEGYIVYEGQKFVTPSAWSIHVKRLANPSKKADDGWKSVKYTPSGETLELFKDRLALLQVQASDALKNKAPGGAAGGAYTNGTGTPGAIVGGQGGAGAKNEAGMRGAAWGGGTAAAAGGKAGMAAAAAEADNDADDEEDTVWSRCDRCQQLRLIPAAALNSVVDGEPWYCEYQQPWKPGASCSDPPVSMTGDDGA